MSGMDGPPAKKVRTEGLVAQEPVAGQHVGTKSALMLTVKEIATDKLTRIAQSNWSTEAAASSEAPAFSAELVKTIYAEELGGSSEVPPTLKRVMLLEISQYLENYLWPNFDATTASYEHVMSMMLMVNEKFRERVPPWSCFRSREDVFPAFFQRVMKLKDDISSLKMHEQTAHLLFAINTFQSLEDEMVRGQVLRLVSLPLWHALSTGRLQLELHAQPQLAKHWRHLSKKEAKAAGKPGYVPIPQRPESRFIVSLVEEFLDVLDEVVQPAANGGTAGANGAGGGAEVLDPRRLLFCERFVEFTVDLLSQLPTRRFVRTVLEDRALLVKCRLCGLYSHPSATLFRQLVDLFQFYMNFPIDDHTGEPQSEEAVIAKHYEKISQLQRLLFKHWPALRELALSNCGAVEKRDVLKRHLAPLSEEELHTLVVKQLRLVAEGDPWASESAFLMEVMLSTYEARRQQRDIINEIPLYPTETTLWDPNQIPSAHFTGESALALPKLNLQFLTAHDYLLRNFHLFRLEATYEIREDIADVLSRVGPRLDADDETITKFTGWARMALPLKTFKIVEVGRPKVGESKPAAVTAEVVIDTRSLRGPVAGEWDETKQHDVLFLLTIRAPDEITAAEVKAAAAAEGRAITAAEKFGLTYARGCEVIEVRDEQGCLMNDFTGRVKPDERKPPEGYLRTLLVAMDTAQYQLDMNAMAQRKSEDPYATFNLLMRRKPKENNFKAILESIRDIMNEDIIIPTWLHDIFLGYGDPAAAQWTSLPPEHHLRTIDFKDTFLDPPHITASFPQYRVRIEEVAGGKEPVPPFRITFPQPPAAEAPQKAGDAEAADGAAAPPSTAAPMDAEAPQGELVVEAYTPPNPGPYPQDQPRRNTVRFTPVQLEAIRSGVQPGLTMVVGPPGTGKTDTAVQVMHVLYHNCPEQRTLLITHSNQALNDLFQKCLERDIPARYLLRLGMGEADLDTTHDFSRVGRVNAMLTRRLELLAEVEKMAKQFGVAEDVAYTCETAAHFWLLHVLSRWEKFSAGAAKLQTPQCIADLFPFTTYFADAPQPLFKRQSYEEDLEIARGCFRHMRTMFQELEEIRPFELLKGQADRVNYLLTRQAKIVAMTCTHAALKRHEFLALGFKYDNLVMEEAAQILEVETFIPMVLQRQEDGVARLKRVILIGDHHQLPPVVKNMAFQRYSQLDQPLFTRFIRLGTPYIQLNAQGRARPSIAKLYNWRYKELGDLPNVLTTPEYLKSNAGFAYEYQFVDVPDYMGVGESEPVPYFYQNLGEAEYLVSVFQFMRLLGYPAQKISILTTYNGQKALLRDVIERRCAGNPLFGRPHKVTTVDKYQGQQNDYILLSLVRSRTVGHLRDVRRLVVAMSRSRLGLYVFGRQQLFSNCYELQPTFKQLMQRPTQLALVKGESHGQVTREAGAPVEFDLVAGLEAMALLAHKIAEEKEHELRAGSEY